MTVLLAPPIRAKKELICRGDEATVSRILSGRYKGMVERLQRGPRAITQYFDIKLGDHVQQRKDFGNNTLPYHLLHYLALRLAYRLFPENFPRAHTLHISKEGTVCSAMYTDYVPDGNGRLKRTASAMKRYYEGNSDQEREAIRLAADEVEHALSPGLSHLVDEIQSAGLKVPHPEANYHLSGENLVFFEIWKVDFPRTLNYLLENAPADKTARDMLVQLHLFVLMSMSEPYFRDHLDTELSELPYKTQSSVVFFKTPLRNLMRRLALLYDKGPEALVSNYKNPLDMAEDMVFGATMVADSFKGGCPPELPIDADKQVFLLF